MEICLDCKNKVVRFYHFKRRVKEAQIKDPQELRSPRFKPTNSKIVLNIVEIVEKYTEKCSISTIKVDESSRKLIIEPMLSMPSTQVTKSIRGRHKATKNSSKDQELELMDEMVSKGLQDSVNIKEEVFADPINVINYTNQDDEQNDDEDNDDDDDDDEDYDENSSLHSYNRGASTSTKPPATKKRKIDPSLAKYFEEHHKKILKSQMEFQARMQKELMEIKKMTGSTVNMNSITHMFDYDKFAFPIKDYQTLLEFCERLEQDSSYMAKKAEELREVSTYQGDLKKHLKNFMPYLIDKELVLQCNFIGSGGKEKIPEIFSNFIIKIHALNGPVVLLEFKKALSMVFSDIKQLIKKNMINQQERERRSLESKYNLEK